MHCTTLLAILTLAILLHRGICLVCYTCYSEKSFENCDQQINVRECPPEANDTCTTYTNFRKLPNGTKIKFFAKACSQGKFCSMADYHCCTTDKCNTVKMRNGEMGTQLASGLLLGAWAISQLVLTMFMY